MGYLSCKAESAIATISSPNTQQNPTNSKPEKPFKIQQFHYSDLEAATNGFSEQKLLGKGSHGSVYKAVLRGRDVAVKKPSKGHEINQEVDNEIDILSKIHSPRLVNLLGFATDTKDRLLVVEFMSNGTLFDILHSSSRPPNWGRRIRLALQIAKAIETLHSQNPPIIHRDIKSANVLIDKNFNAKLGDFGLALRCGVDDYRLKSTPPAGTMGYLDPCYVTPNNLSTKTDVFSFGILLLEIISGRKAIDMSYSPSSVVDWAIPLVKKGKLGAIYDPKIAPPRDLFVRKQLALIAAKCVRSCKERRPAMKDVVNWLASLIKLVPLHSWNAFNNSCLMVEAVDRPVEFRSTQFGLRAENDGGDNLDGVNGKFGFRAIKSSQRVYSDLGFRSNLMELMADTDGQSGRWGELDEVDNNSNSSHRVFSHRFGSRGHGYKGRIQSLDHCKNKDAFRLKRNQSVGSDTEVFSRGDNAISYSSINVQLANIL